MKRVLVPSPPFLRKAKRIAKKPPGSAEAIRDTLKLLAEDTFHPSLQTQKAILLESVGSHDEVY